MQLIAYLLTVIPVVVVPDSPTEVEIRCVGIAVPERHKPLVTMGRDCWRVLTKYSSYGCTGRPTIGFDNEELNNSPVFSDVAFCYVASEQPPPAKTGLAVWPRFEQYFRKDEPDAEILTSNPHPDRPFFLTRRSERNKGTWGSPVELGISTTEASGGIGLSLRTHTTVNSTTTGCTGSDGRMSAGGGIDRKKSV